MSPETKAIIEETARATVEEMRKLHRCECPVGNEKHYQHHELIDEVVEFLKRFRDARWFVFRTLLLLSVIAIIGVFGAGLAVKVGKFFGLHV